MAETLSQVVGIEKSVKSKVYSQITELHKLSQKPDLFNGFNKQYEKINAADEDLPAESVRVQYTAEGMLENLSRVATELFDISAKRDYTNRRAGADVTIDGVVIVGEAPVPFLLFLEKQLLDIRKFVETLPVLDEANEWAKDGNVDGVYRAAPTTTHRTKKTVRPIVLYDATKEHPAQTQLINEDMLAGYWRLVKQSGAIPRRDRDAIVERVDALQYAVKRAIAKANETAVVDISSVGRQVFNYLLNQQFGRSSS